jgi:hypothetical protein
MAHMNRALKEWAIIVDALGRGDQILVLRSGGISEKNRHFRIDRRDFLLFPTHHHQHREGVTEQIQPRFDELHPTLNGGNQVRLEYVASAAGWWKVSSFEDVLQLEGQHIWREEAVARRFNSGQEEGLYVLALRVSRLPKPAELPMDAAAGGCRSWLDLSASIPTRGARPVLSDGAFARRMADLIRRFEPVGTRVIA